MGSSCWAIMTSGALGPGRDGRHRDELRPTAFRPGQRLTGAGGAFGDRAELPFVGQPVPSASRAEITILHHRRPLGRAHRVAEPLQQRRRAGHAEISQQPAHREGGAPEGAAQVELLRAVVEVPRCQARLEVRVFEQVPARRLGGRRCGVANRDVGSLVQPHPVDLELGAVAGAIQVSLPAFGICLVHREGQMQLGPIARADGDVRSAHRPIVRLARALDLEPHHSRPAEGLHAGCEGVRLADLACRHLLPELGIDQAAQRHQGALLVLARRCPRPPRANSAPPSLCSLGTAGVGRRRRCRSLPAPRRHKPSRRLPPGAACAGRGYGCPPALPRPAANWR